MSEPVGRARLSRYIMHLTSMLGSEPSVVDVPVRVPDDGPVSAVVFLGGPVPGVVTGFTYGLSSPGDRPGVELTIRVRSNDRMWAQVPAHIVGALRGLRAFRPGQVIGHIGPYVESSPMNCVLLTESKPEKYRVDLGTIDGGADIVEFIDVVPIHAAEFDLIRREGAAALDALSFDRFDVTRPPAL